MLHGLFAFLGLMCLAATATTTQTVHLKLGDNCTYEYEKVRQENLTKIFELDDSAALYLEMITNFDKTGHTLCPGEENLVCQEKSGKCACGNSIFEALIPKNDIHFVEEGDKCRWNRQTPCLSEELSKKYNNFTNKDIPLDWKCKEGTTCKTLDGAGDCTQAAVEKYIEIASKNTDGKSFPAVVLKEVVLGKVCTCQDVPPPPPSPSTTTTNSPKNTGITETKKSSAGGQYPLYFLSFYSILFIMLV